MRGHLPACCGDLGLIFRTKNKRKKEARRQEEGEGKGPGGRAEGVQETAEDCAVVTACE